MWAGCAHGFGAVRIIIRQQAHRGTKVSTESPVSISVLLLHVDILCLCSSRCGSHRPQWSESQQHPQAAQLEKMHPLSRWVTLHTVRQPFCRSCEQWAGRGERRVCRMEAAGRRGLEVAGHWAPAGSCSADSCPLCHWGQRACPAAVLQALRLAPAHAGLNRQRHACRFSPGGFLCDAPCGVQGRPHDHGYRALL